jgi:hypothetical protein
MEAVEGFGRNEDTSPHHNLQAVLAGSMGSSFFDFSSRASY